MYLRFVVSVKTGRGHERRGLFQIMDRLRDLDPLRLPRARALAAWFNRYLAVPGEDAFRVERSFCWFKLGAARHVERSRELLSLYRAAGCRGLEIWSRDPGVVTYEDEAQIVARPRHGGCRDAY